jgi:hypothetical protein
VEHGMADDVIKQLARTVTPLRDVIVQEAA